MPPAGAPVDASDASVASGASVACGAFERTVGPLRLRRPTPADAEAYLRLHAEPRADLARPAEHRADGRPSTSGSDALAGRIRLADDIEHWQVHGFGYLAVEEVATGRVVGWGGVRSYPGHDALNLYYRISADVRGRGYGRVLARAVTVGATEALPGRRVRASIDPGNRSSRHTALAAGLTRLERSERSDGPEQVYELPHVEAVEVVDGVLREELLVLWMRADDSGGSVGFLPGAVRADVEPVLDGHLAETHEGSAVLGLLRDPDGRVAGFGWWRPRPEPLYDHVATLWRLKVDPERRGRNLGRLLLAGLHGLARDHPGVELLRPDYRSGSGLGEYPDDVAMMCRVEGRALGGDGLT